MNNTNEIAELLRDIRTELKDWRESPTIERLCAGIDKALAALQAEPVAWLEGDEIYFEGAGDLNDYIRQNGQPLYMQPQPAKAPDYDALKGVTVSVDASTGDEDAHRRLFAEITGWVEDRNEGVVLLAEKDHDNYSTQPAKVPEWFMAKMNQHALSAAECPPQVQVVPLYSINRLALTAAPAAGEDWVKCSERMPTVEDADDRGNVWVFNADHPKSEPAMVAVKIPAWITHWMPTGLCKPTPPTEDKL